LIIGNCRTDDQTSRLKSRRQSLFLSNPHLEHCVFFCGYGKNYRLQDIQLSKITRRTFIPPAPGLHACARIPGISFSDARGVAFRRRPRASSISSPARRPALRSNFANRSSP